MVSILRIARYHTLAHICFSALFSSFILLMSIGTKEMTLSYSILALLTIIQRKRHYEVFKTIVSIVIFILLAAELIPCFWPILQTFQNPNNSAKYEPNSTFYGSKSKLVH